MKFIPVLALVFATQAFASGYYLPNSTLTPGAVQSTDTTEVCDKGYPERARHVTATTKKRVYERYGVSKQNCVQGCKIDHLIPLSVGGSNDVSNLWPHEYGAEWSVFEKTRLEVRLRKAVCIEQMPIAQAQACIQKNWTLCYQQFYPGEHEKKLLKAK